MLKKNFIWLFFSFLVLSCSKKEESLFFSSPENFPEYELSFDNVFLSNFSVKFTESDTVYLKYNSVDEKLKDSILPDQLYYALVSKNERKPLLEFIKTTDFEKSDSSFAVSEIPRGIEYRLYLKKNKEEYFFTLHELDKAPKNMDSLVHKTLRIIPKTNELKKSSKKINFHSRITTPPPPPEFEVDSANFD